MTLTIDAPIVNTNPFKFLESYSKDEKNLFVGRDHEIEQLYELAHSGDYLLVFGESGVGKTSLIQCGLANRFQETDWLDVWIYRQDDINSSLKNGLLSASNKSDKGESARELIKSLYLKHFKPVYLIFDQLEEIYVLGKESERNLFYKELEHIHAENIACKFIFIIREEFHSRLHELEKHLTSIFRRGVKVNRMGTTNAHKVVEKSILAAQVSVSPSLDVITQMIIDACKDKNETVNLPDLQVFLYMLWKKGYKEYEPVGFDEDLIREVGKIENVLRDYLHECIADCIADTGQHYEIKVWTFLNQFVTSEGTPEGTKKPVQLSALKDIDLITAENWISILERKKILRRFGIKKGTYELAHDSLAPLIQASQPTLKRIKLIEPTIKGNPYKGLLSYNEEDRDCFFGRNTIVETLYEKVKKDRLVAVVGSSGTGKSSLIKAGILPKMKEDGYYCISIKPGASPHHMVFYLKHEVKKSHSNKYVVYIDQFEELSTQCEVPADRETFIQFIHNIAEKEQIEGEPEFKIILSIRADYEHEFDSAFKNWRLGKINIPPLSDKDIRDIVIEPAYHAGLEFHPTYLVDVIVNEVKQSNGTLPLLSYTLSQMYEEYIKSDRNDQTLTEVEYNVLGGVVDGLRSRANKIYDDASTCEQRTIRNVMLRMVALGINEKAGKRILASDLIYASDEENKRVQKILNGFIDKRLIITGKDSMENIYFEPAHDSLVRTWEVIGYWIEKYGKEILFLQKKLTEAVLNFESENSLWNDNPRLDILKDILNSEDNWLNIREISFVRASLEKRNDILEYEKEQIEEKNSLLLEKIEQGHKLNKVNEEKLLESRRYTEDILLRTWKLRKTKNILLIVSFLVLMFAILSFIGFSNSEKEKKKANNLNIELRKARDLAEEETANAQKSERSASSKARSNNDLANEAIREKKYMEFTLSHLKKTLTDLKIEKERNKLAQQSGNLLGLAKNYENITPALSYRLAELAIIKDPFNPDIKTYFKNLSEKKGFYETVVIKSPSGIISDNGGVLLTIYSNDKLMIWDMEGKKIGEYHSASPIVRASFSPTGQLILLHTESGLSIHDLSGKNVTEFSKDSKESIMATFSNDGGFIISISFDELMIWSTSGVLIRKTLSTFYNILGPNNIRVNNKHILIKSSGRIDIYSINSGEHVKTISNPNSFLLPNASGFVTWENNRINRFDDNGDFIKSYYLNILPAEYPILESISFSQDASTMLLTFNRSSNNRKSIMFGISIPNNILNNAQVENKDIFVCTLNILNGKAMNVPADMGKYAVLSANGKKILTGEFGYIGIEDLTNQGLYNKIIFGESTLYNRWAFNPANENIIITESQDKDGMTTRIWNFGTPKELEAQNKLKKFNRVELKEAGIE